jgi:hypothetical protein
VVAGDTDMSLGERLLLSNEKRSLFTLVSFTPLLAAFAWLTLLGWLEPPQAARPMAHSATGRTRNLFIRRPPRGVSGGS